MANLDFRQVLETLKNGVTGLATSTFQNYTNAAKTDALNLIDMIQGNLKTWTVELAEGKISTKDFEYLVLGQKEVVEMMALKNAGISAIELDKLKGSIFQFIIKTVTGFI